MKGNQDLKQGRPQPRPRKEYRFKMPKTSPLDMATCNTKIGKDGNISPVHCQNFEGAKVQLFEGRKRIYIVFYSHFRKLHLCTLNFLYLLFFLENKINWTPPHPLQQGFSKSARKSFVQFQHCCTFLMPAASQAAFTQKLALSSLFWVARGEVGLSLAPSASLGTQEVAI